MTLWSSNIAPVLSVTIALVCSSTCIASLNIYNNTNILPYQALGGETADIVVYRKRLAQLQEHQTVINKIGLRIFLYVLGTVALTHIVNATNSSKPMTLNSLPSFDK